MSVNTENDKIYDVIFQEARICTSGFMLYHFVQSNPSCQHSSSDERFWTMNNELKKESMWFENIVWIVCHQIMILAKIVWHHQNICTFTIIPNLMPQLFPSLVVFTVDVVFVAFMNTENQCMEWEIYDISQLYNWPAR